MMQYFVGLSPKSLAKFESWKAAFFNKTMAYIYIIMNFLLIDYETTVRNQLRQQNYEKVRVYLCYNYETIVCFCDNVFI